jgi:vacuolar protein sorting-associated protein 3
MIDLELASLIPLFPLSQAPDKSVVVKPSITVINENEFLILSWTGASTIGVFINGDGDPVRGTLEWPAHPQAVCMYHDVDVYIAQRADFEIGFDHPYVTALLPNDTIEIHSLETQSIVQVISAPKSRRHSENRSHLATCLNGYMVPSTEQSDKMRMISVPLRRRPHDDDHTGNV